MKTRVFRRSLLVGLALAGLLAVVPAVFAAEPGAERLRESGAAQIESLLAQSIDFNGVTPTFTDYGDGFYSLSAPLDPATLESLLAMANGAGDKKAPASSLAFLAAGQSLTTPSNPAALVHAALSHTLLTYNYWVVVVNAGSQTVTKATSFKLIGPGLTFNRTVSAAYHANGFTVVWVNPSSGVHNAGLYTFVGGVSGLGTFTTHTVAVDP